MGHSGSQKFTKATVIAVMCKIETKRPYYILYDIEAKSNVMCNFLRQNLLKVDRAQRTKELPDGHYALQNF